MDYLQQILTLIAPSILDIVGTLLAGVISAVALTARKRWGIEIEARHREALHSALMSGIRMALSKGLTEGNAVEAAIGHALLSVPDAVKALGPSQQILSSIAEAKLIEAARK